jgi:hypothetical protein
MTKATVTAIVTALALSTESSCRMLAVSIPFAFGKVKTVPS